MNAPRWIWPLSIGALLTGLGFLLLQRRQAQLGSGTIEAEQLKEAGVATTATSFVADTIRVDPKKLNISPKGLALIKKFEGFVSTLYNDAANHCTVGFGTLVHKGLCNGSEPVGLKNGVTEQEATDLLLQHVQSAVVPAIHRNVKVPLYQHEFDALASWLYNLGEGNLIAGGPGGGPSTLLKKINAKEYAAIPAELNKWVHAGGQVLSGLQKRRAQEGALWQGEAVV